MIRGWMEVWGGLWEAKERLVPEFRRFLVRLRDPVRCYFDDCSGEHPVAAQDEGVTCPTCRSQLGLPPLV